ncbi:MAG: TIGR03905 family TSCPD domain-containing protein [Bacilli bacterium]|jgi:uncharacterized protein (TIGR03905 family)|nr:TIGR03905 family TSCPD domain-containing protein [Bacilli bacterium]MCH4228757.1 TIGR03905 family TSCPD domain-containing protein [Bacilli bacterium]MCH4278077.1 TIGR03905 family TSCPD domain-containing protein [Bacilli bacterium]MCI2055499.1 TIGR03905 family TSCPD domain-containing protein [Bacilli bacterium]
MEKTYHFKPSDVCSREMIIVYDGDTVIKATTIGGCSGNTQGVNKLMEGRKIDDVIALLSGIRCPGSRTKMTSCPDQMARALEEIKKSEGK